LEFNLFINKVDKGGYTILQILDNLINDAALPNYVEEPNEFCAELVNKYDLKRALTFNGICSILKRRGFISWIILAFELIMRSDCHYSNHINFIRYKFLGASNFSSMLLTSMTSAHKLTFLLHTYGVPRFIYNEIPIFFTNICSYIPWYDIQLSIESIYNNAPIFANKMVPGYVDSAKASHLFDEPIHEEEVYTFFWNLLGDPTEFSQTSYIGFTEEAAENKLFISTYNKIKDNKYRCSKDVYNLIRSYVPNHESLEEMRNLLINSPKTLEENAANIAFLPNNPFGERKCLYKSNGANKGLFDYTIAKEVLINSNLKIDSNINQSNFYDIVTTALKCTYSPYLIFCKAINLMYLANYFTSRYVTGVQFIDKAIASISMAVPMVQYPFNYLHNCCNTFLIDLCGEGLRSDIIPLCLENAVFLAFSLAVCKIDRRIQSYIGSC
jgi:hypothetical protein